MAVLSRNSLNPNWANHEGRFRWKRPSMLASSWQPQVLADDAEASQFYLLLFEDLIADANRSGYASSMVTSLSTALLSSAGMAEFHSRVEYDCG